MVNIFILKDIHLLKAKVGEKEQRWEERERDRITHTEKDGPPDSSLPTGVGLG